MSPWSGIVGRGFTADEFATYAAQLKLTLWRPQFVVLHNTGEPTLAQWHSCPGEQRMQNLQHYYRDTEHWSAEPHLFIADDEIWCGTPLTMPGVHSPSWNKVSVGVEIVGAYDTEVFTDQVGANVIAALIAVHKLYRLHPATLRFHKEDPLTTHRDCPGKAIVKAEIVAELLDAFQL